MRRIEVENVAAATRGSRQDRRQLAQRLVRRRQAVDLDRCARPTSHSASSAEAGDAAAARREWRRGACFIAARSGGVHQPLDVDHVGPDSAGRPAARRAGAAAAGRCRSIALMRPGERVSTTTRSDRNTASSTLWVTNSTVLRSRSQISSSSFCRPRAGVRIERAERLVHQQDARAVGQRARDRDALLHAAGQLLGIEVLVAREMHQRDQRARAASASALRHALLDRGRTSRCRARSSRETARIPGTPGRGPAPAR